MEGSPVLGGDVEEKRWWLGEQGAVSAGAPGSLSLDVALQKGLYLNE